MPKGDGPFPCVVTIHGGHLALRTAELMGQELLCVAVGSPWMTDPFAYMAGDATKPPLSLVPEKARIALTENGKRLMSGLTRRTGSEEKANAVMREHSIEANAEKIGLERTRECGARECRAKECGANDSRERECGAREYGAVAALLTEPPSRPKVSGITGDLRSAFSAGSYAAPPVGELRWRAPQPVPKWAGVRKAHDYGHDAPQRNQWAPHQDEGCLYLNVWAPARGIGFQPAESERSRQAGSQSHVAPVMVWIHGGAFVSGSGRIHGEAFAKQGVLFVSFNYRLDRGDRGFAVRRPPL